MGDGLHSSMIPRLLAACVALAACSVAFAATPPAKITLSAQEQKVMAAACGAAGLDTATPRQKGASGAAASVRCRPHGKDGEVDVARVAQCEKKGGAWKCAPARDALLIPLFDDSVLALVAEGVRGVEAVQVAESVAAMKVPPFQRGAIDVLQGECTLTQLPERLFKGATHFKVDCAAATLELTRDCWDKRCRFFITNSIRND
jgi:hypothetical protein